MPDEDLPDKDLTEKFDPRFDPRYQPGYQGQNVAMPYQVERPPKSSTHSADTDTGEEQPDQDVLPTAPHSFERTLLTVGAVLIIGGVAVAFWANGINYSQVAIGHPWTWQALLQSAAWTVSAPMVTVGLAIGAGVLFRRAITWNREK